MTIDGEPVVTTVSPMASGDLSVALVIDTASGLTSQELAAVQNGAIEFLLRLPGGAHTMVVTAAGQPEVVAALDERRAEALSAISALRVGGSRATMPATMLAAQSLESAPPGPRAIIVYTHGPDEQGMLPDRLSQAVLHSEAVVNVIQTGTDPRWPSVVEQAGGSVVTTSPENIVRSFGDLAATLDDQYLVTFQVPDELPAVARVAYQAGDQEYTTVVNLPDSGPAQPAPTESNEGPSARGVPLVLVALLVAGLALVVAQLILTLRARRRALLATAEKPSAAAAGPSGTLTTAPATMSLPPRSRRGSLTDAVQGVRSAQHALALQAERELRRRSAQDQQHQGAPGDTQPRPRAPDSLVRPGKSSAQPRVAQLMSRLRSKIAARVAAAENRQSAEGVRDAGIVLTGAGDAAVELAKNAAGPAAVHISGNSASRYFAVRAVGTEDDLVITLRPYQGVRSLNWNGGESTGFEVRATGPWRIKVLPLSAIPTFNGSFNGDGDMVVHFTGDGSLAEIIGNDAGRYFHVHTLGPDGTDRLVNTAQKYSGSSQISGGPQFFEVQAIGPWTITIK